MNLFYMYDILICLYDIKVMSIYYNNITLEEEEL